MAPLKGKTGLAIISLLIFSALYGDTYFGQNKVQFVNREWMFIETSRFKLYYPVGYDSLAFLAVNIINDQYNKLREDLGFTPQIKIPVVFYPTPNEFYETNIIWDILGEGVGGFTESLKNRVVVPFTGSYKEFEHTIRHELTHAFVFDFLYGKNRGGIFSPSRIFNLPIWFSEGLSEFESKEWEIDDDYYLRDLILNGGTEPLDKLDGYKAYRQGQAVVRYIAEKYGRKKLGELIAKGRMLLTMNKALKSVLGISEDELYEDWLHEAKKQYLPELNGRMFPTEFARRLTDHKKNDGAYNFQPVISPDGAYIAYLSDKNGYMSLYLIDIIEGKTRLLLKGEQSGKYESFHPLWCQVAWNPDCERIAFVTKRKNRDVIVIYDIKKKKELLYYKLNYGGLYSISFSHSGDKIAFSALDRLGKDIFILDMESKKIMRLTDDKYDDDHPIFSKNDSIIYFSSDRPSENLFEPGKFNIFALEIKSGKISPITKSDIPNYNPVILDTTNLLYITEENGIPNLAIMNLCSGEYYPITNSITPIISPSASADGEKIVFATLFEWGWDIYLMDTFSPCTLSATIFMRSRKNKPTHEEHPPFSETLDTLTQKEELKQERYSPQFSPDFISSSISYNNFYGLQGYTALLLSDIFGDHQILILSDLLNNFNNSNFLVSYGYFKPRMPYGITLFHNFTYYQDEKYRLFSDRTYGIGGFMEYPFNRFLRFESEAGYFGVERKYYEIDTTSLPEYVNSVQLRVGFVKDNTLWSTSGPIAGQRWKTGFELLPSLGSNSYSYFSLNFDLRNYHHFGKGYGLALRLTAGASGGKNPKLYYLGGAESWLNWELGSSEIYTIRSMYFSEIITPLRGYALFELVGTKYYLANIELRYPFINELRLGFPLPITIRGLRGGIFADIGGAFDKPTLFRGVKNGGLNHIKLGVGCGIRTGISFLLFSWDIGWATDLVHISPHPTHYLTLSTEF